MGKIQLPDEADRRKDMDAWLHRHGQLGSDGECIDFQASYIDDLVGATDYPEFPVHQQADLFKQWQEDKKEKPISWVFAIRFIVQPLPAPWGRSCPGLGWTSRMIPLRGSCL